MYENILVDAADQIVTITVNRPQALNALNRKTVAELTAAVEGLDCSVRVVILTGAGEKAFVAGADIAEMVHFDPHEALRFAQAGHALMRKIEEARAPVIAAVHGFALGGGCELALACDFIYASTRAWFGQPEVNLGAIPGFGGTQRLARRVGLARARELIYTGRRIGAEEALRIGLCNAVFEPAELLGKTREVALEIAQKSPGAIAQAKRALAVDPQGVILAGHMTEAELFGELFASADRKEGMQAFLEKRKPKWTSS
ncbi:MAG TPA: enoyl-CoA hydratase-related protein [Polyangia bacterium]|nr:enoyl-CoA hydratase-related protein [Polyangia bacterium]